MALQTQTCVSLFGFTSYVTALLAWLRHPSSSDEICGRADEAVEYCCSPLVICRTPLEVLSLSGGSEFQLEL